MRNKVKGKVLSILLAAVLTGSLCAGMTAEAQEAEEQKAEAVINEQASGSTVQLNINVRYGQSEARNMLDMINAFRTGSDAWYLTQSGSRYEATGLSELTYDYDLEQIAMQRAAEIALSFAHERPDGTSEFEMSCNGISPNGENIAAGYSTAAGTFEQWQETDESYSGQGHRRNMLNEYFRTIGIGHAYFNGYHYWVQEFGAYPPQSSATAPNDSEKAVSVDVLKSKLTSVDVSVEGQKEYKIYIDGQADLPSVSSEVRISKMFPDRAVSSKLVPDWEIGNTSIAEISNGKLTGKKAGKTNLTAVVMDKTVTVPVTVTEKKQEIPGESGSCGENADWGYDAGSRTLTISGTGAVSDYESSFDTPWEEISGEDGVQKIIVEDGITEIGDYAFSRFQGVKNVELPASLTRLGKDSFDECGMLSAITVESGNRVYSSADGVLFNKSQTELLRYPAGKNAGKYVVPGKVKKIGNSAFRFCERLTQVVLNDNVEEIGENAFWNCNITNVYLGKRLKVVGDSAFGNTGLTSVTLLSRIKWGKDVFDGCSRLTRATVEEGVTAIPDRTFDSCISLTSVSLPSSLLTIGKSAFEYTGLKKVVLPGKVKTVGERAFYQSESLESIVIPASVTGIGEDAFCDCDKLTIKCYPDTAGYRYAKDNNIPYEFISGAGDDTDDTETPDPNPDPNPAPGGYKVTKISLSASSGKIAAGKKVKLTAKVLPANASNKAVVWKSSNPKVATVNASGVVTMNKKSGGKSVTITATAADGSQVSASYKLTSMKDAVKKIAISGKSSVKAGKSLKLKAKVTAGKKANKKLKWTSSSKKYASVSSSGKVKTYKAGKGKKVKITAAATDGSGKKKSITIKIK